MNILAVGANPDDVELLCSGTLALYSKRGDNIHICYISNGDKGGNGEAPESVAKTRAMESRQAGALINAKLYPLNIPDGEVCVSLELRRKLVSVIRQTKADVIITHSDNDYMSDHNCTSTLVMDAAFWSAVAEFKGDPDNSALGSHAPKVVYQMETVAGIGFAPEEYVDITDVIDLKIGMLSSHKSQVRYMMERDGLDFVDCMITTAKYRGYQCGVKYAEGFVRVKKYPFLTTNRLLP